MATPPKDLVSPPSDLVGGSSGEPPKDLVSPPSDLVETDSKAKVFLKKALSKVETAAKGAEAVGKAALAKVTGGKASDYEFKPEEYVDAGEAVKKAFKTGGITSALSVGAPYAVEAAGKIAPKIAPAPLKPAAEAFSLAAPEIAMAMKTQPGIVRGLEGFVGGTAASGAGSVAQSYGLPAPVQTLAEMAGGVAGVKGTEAVEWGVNKIAGSSLAKAVLKRVMPEVLPSEMAKSASQKQAESIIKGRLFGKPEDQQVDLTKSPASSEAVNEIQNEHNFVWDKSKYSSPSNQYLAETVKPSLNPQQVFQSDKYRELNSKIDSLGAQAFPTDKRLILDVLAEGDPQKIFSLAKHGRTVPKFDNYGREIKAPELSTEVRKEFEKTLVDITGGKDSPYTTYNKIFRKEKIAEARDAIPRMVSGEVSNRMNPAELKKYAVNIAESPESKQLFATGLNQYFRDYSGKPEQMVSKLNDLRPILQDSGVMTTQQIDALQRKIRALPEGVTLAKKKIMVNKIVTNALSSAVGAKVTSATQSEEE